MRVDLISTHLEAMDTTRATRDLVLNLREHFSENELSTLLDVPVDTCIKASVSGEVEFDQLHRIRSACGLSMTNFKFNSIDYKTVLGKLKQQTVIPARYTTSTYSSKKTSASILYHLPTTLKQDALDFLQVDESFYDSSILEDKVSTYLNSDLLFYMAKNFWINDSGLYRLGQTSGFYHKHRDFGRAFKGLSIVASYNKVVDEIVKYFETSYRYELVSLDDKKAVIQRFLTEKIKDEQHVELYSNPYLCKFIQGSFSAISYYSKGKFAHTTEAKCIFRGDSCCEFHVDLTDLRPLS